MKEVVLQLKTEIVRITRNNYEQLNIKKKNQINERNETSFRNM